MQVNPQEQKQTSGKATVISLLPTHNQESNRSKLVVSIAIVGIYSLLFFLLYSYFLNGIVSSLASVPAALIGWFYGKRKGLLGGVILSLWNMLLFILVGENALMLTVLGPGIVGSFFLIGMGGFMGWLGSLVQQTQMQALDLAREIDERKSVEQKLRASEAYNRAVLSAFPDMVFMLSPEGRLLAYRAHDASDLYIEPENVVESNIKDVMPVEFVELCLQHITQAVETRTVQSFEYQLSMPHGIQDYEARLSVVDDTKILAIVRNITQQKLAQQQRTMLTLQHERIRTLNELLNNFSHDFRTPLSIINTNVYLLSRHLSSEEANIRLQRIQHQSLRLEVYIEAILTLANLESKPEFQLKPLQLNYLLETLETRFQTIAKRQGVQLTYQCDTPSAQILGHQENLVQALDSLIRNAIHYNKENGSVTVYSYVRGQQVVVEIRDTGIGIESSHYDRIFEPFFRIDQARGLDSGGVGLGLTIARKVIDRHQGTIEVESQPEQGSTFRIILPLLEHHDN